MSVTQPVLHGTQSGGEAGARPRWGMRESLLAALAIAYPFHYYIGSAGGVTDVSLGDAVVGLAVLGFFLSLLWDRIAFPRYIIPVAVFMLVALASLIYPLMRVEPAPAFLDLQPGVLEIVKVAGSAAWMLGIYALLRRAPIAGMRVFVTVSVLVASAFALGTILQSLTEAKTRPSGPFENENLYANYLALNVFLAAMLARLHELDGARGTRVPLWLATPILLVGILATGSRGALLGSVLAYPLILRWRRPSMVSGRRLAAAVLAVGLSGWGLVAFWQANPFIAWRISTIVSGQGPNIQERSHLWEMAIEAFASSPVLGIGYHQFPQYAEAVYGWKNQVAHNTYLTMAAELGGIGLIAFAWLFVPVIRDAVRISRGAAFSVGRPVLAIVAATLIQGFVANVEHYRSLWIAMGLLAGIDGVVARRSGLGEPVPAPEAPGAGHLAMPFAP
jgi:O-antigen ligase